MRMLRRNLVSTYVVYAASFLSAFVLTPVVVHALGKDGYGVWTWIGSATIFVGLLDLGVGPSIVRFGAFSRGREAPEDLNALASVGLVVYGVIGALSVIVGLGLAAVLPFVLSLPHGLVWPARAATLLVIAGIAARFPLGMFNNLLLAQQRYDLVNLGNLVGVVVYAALVGAVLTQRGSIILLALFTLAATVVRLVVPLFWLRRELPHLQLRRSLVTRGRVRELMTFSGHNFLIHVAAKIVFSTDVIVVGVVLGPKAVAYYGIPARVFGLVMGLGTGATDLLYPAFAELEGADELQRQRRLLLSGLRLGMSLMLLLALPLVLMPDQLIRGWIGAGWGRSTWVMVLLAAALLVHQPAHVITQYLIARGRQRELANLLLGVVGTNLALSIVLAATVGIWGVALSTVVTESAATFFLIPRLVSRSFGLSYGALATASFRPVLPALLVAAPILVGLSRFFDPGTLVGLAPIGALWVIAFVPAVWLFGVSGSERAGIAVRFRGRPAGA